MSKHAQLYGTRWRRARKWFLAHNPLCVMCGRRGVTTLAEVVDHIRPHRGDLKLFWDVLNWQPLCKRCHDSDKQSAERLDQIAGCDADGYPADVDW